MISPDATGDTAPPADSNRWAELKPRIISAVALGAAVLALTIAGGAWFAGLVILAALLMHEEWKTLAPTTDERWRIAGYVYVIAPCLALLWLREYSHAALPGEPPTTGEGLAMVLYILFVVWATDIGAYFAGRTIGGPKILPAISPKKTWAGLLGGMAAAGFVGAVMQFFTPYPASFASALTLSMLLAVVAQGGDFFESWLKRRAGVKDSGTLIPGHGGLLDRVDGLMTAVPIYAILAALNL